MNTLEKLTLELSRTTIPGKNAMHVHGMLLAFVGMSTWYLHETCMCHACALYVSCTLYNTHLTTMHVSGLPCMLQYVRNLHSVHVSCKFCVASNMHVLTMHVLDPSHVQCMLRCDTCLSLLAMFHCYFFWDMVTISPFSGHCIGGWDCVLLSLTLAPPTT